LKNKQPTQNQPDLNPRIWNDNPTPLLDKEKPALRFRQSTFGMKPLKNLTEAKQRLSEIATKFGGSFRIVESPPPENNPQISFQTQNSADFAALENALKKDSRGLITLENGWQKNKAENRLTLTFSESAMLLGHRIENHNDNNHIYAKSVLEELIHSKKNQKGIHPKFSGETPSLKQTFVQFIHSKLEKPVKNNHEAKQRLNEIATKFGGTFRIETPNQSLNPQISFQTEDFAILKDALKKGSNNSIELKHGWQKNVAENRITLTFSESAILLGHPIRRDGDHSEKTARSILAQLIS
jgi:hypothetical protein